MAKQTSRNNDFLFACKNEIASAKLYDFIVELVNQGKEDEAKIVAKIDCLFDYLVTAVKARDRFSIKEMAGAIDSRIKDLEKKNIDVSLLKESFDKIIKANKVKL